ncbi:MAG: hypothetical protein JOZ78_05370 [Chroococcidiopsidaceae cyanobacterium CP_BM_ER_R8_30]|nr:hypothetical protein [Chroococcidiopsidaceae cyanobacterium CP_BM_ER_R8_30]
MSDYELAQIKSKLADVSSKLHCLLGDNQHSLSELQGIRASFRTASLDVQALSGEVQALRSELGRLEGMLKRMHEQ